MAETTKIEWADATWNPVTGCSVTSPYAGRLIDRSGMVGVSGMGGEISILNVGAGDTKLTFDPSDPTEVAHSARIVKDMIRRGFVLLIEVGRDEKGPIYRRAHDFNEATAEYIVAGMSADEEIIEPEEPTHDQEPSIPPQRARKATPARAAGRKRIAASGAKAIAVSRTAGG